ncbi:hypothetical protein ACLB2K_033752 [Fragaria x ananassa]
MALSSSTTTGNLKTLEAVVEIKSSADKVYSLISIEHHNVPKASSDKVHDVAVHEGDWETTGSIKLWKYTIDGTVETLKEKVEIDEANKRVSLTALEGHVLNKYRSIKIIYQVIPKSNEGADHLVKVTLEYEKLNESDQPPNNYLSFCVNRLEAVVEIKSSADKVYSLISREHHNVPKASSDNIHDVAVHEGDWETSGSIKLWKYTIDGTVESFKEKVEIDDANKKVSLTALDGHVLEKYKSYKIIFQVIPKSNQGANVAKITLEYEKHNESDQLPNNYFNVVVNIIKDIDAHLIAS